jgi:hypothetical protein
LLDSDAHFLGHEPNAQFVPEILPHMAFVHTSIVVIAAGWNRVALDRFPDPRYGGRAIFELPHRRFARQAIVDFYEPGCGPVCCEFGQRGFVAESFGVGDGFGFLRRAVNGDVVRLVFNRKVLHFQSPGAASAAISTLITSSGKTVKRIVQEICSGERVAMLLLVLNRSNTFLY